MKILPQQLQIEFEKINFVYGHLATGLIMNLLVGGALFTVMRSASGYSQSLLWYSILLLLVLLRFAILFFYRRCKDKITTLKFWSWAFALGACSVGVIWGVGGIMLFPPEDVARQIFLVFILGGMVMGAVPYLSPMLPAYMFFLFPAELPVTLYLLTFSDSLHVILGVVNILFIITMLVAASLNQKNFLHNVMLRFVNQDLVKRLNDTNIELESKIELKNKIEQDLRENENRFKALSNAAHDGVILHKDGIIIEANAAVAKMGGFSVKELIGKPVLDLIAPDCREDIIKRLANPIAETFETIGLRKDGTTFTAELNRGDVAYQGGNARIVSVRDISKQKQIEADLLHAKNAAEAADKLKSEFLASVSHELRTPLNAMIGFMQILDETTLTKEQHDYLGMGEKSARQLLLLINDLLDLSRIETGHFEYHLQDIALKELLTETVQLLSMRAEERNDSLQLEIQSGLPDGVRLDPDRVRQVLINLLGNAIKFTEAGEVRLIAGIELSATGGQMLRFAVKDSGIGIPEDKQDAIFRRFTQLDASISRNYGGAGLGLAISQELVSKMGGDIGVISQPGQGATFWFTLPCETVELPAQAEGVNRNARAAAAMLAGLSVLVVEDEETNQIIARHMLEKLGCRVEVLDNGQQAVDCDKAYDLIIMDMQMPVLDGLAATEQLRLAGNKTPIIAMTANAMQGDRERCLAAGMNDYVSKPIDRDKLLQVIAACLGDLNQAATA